MWLSKNLLRVLNLCVLIIKKFLIQLGCKDKRISIA